MAKSQIKWDDINVTGAAAAGTSLLNKSPALITGGLDNIGSFFRDKVKTIENDNTADRITAMSQFTNIGDLNAYVANTPLPDQINKSKLSEFMLAAPGRLAGIAKDEQGLKLGEQNLGINQYKLDNQENEYALKTRQSEADIRNSDASAGAAYARTNLANNTLQQAQLQQGYSSLINKNKDSFINEQGLYDESRARVFAKNNQIPWSVMSTEIDAAKKLTGQDLVEAAAADKVTRDNTYKDKKKLKELDNRLAIELNLSNPGTVNEQAIATFGESLDNDFFNDTQKNQAINFARSLQMARVPQVLQDKWLSNLDWSNDLNIEAVRRNFTIWQAGKDRKKTRKERKAEQARAAEAGLTTKAKGKNGYIPYN